MLYDDGIIKGIIGKRSSIENSDEIELCDFYVEPAFKGMGIGQEKLIEGTLVMDKRYVKEL